MTRAIILSALMFVAAAGYSVTTEEIRAILDKKTATVGDALLMISSIDKPDMDAKDVNVKSSKRLSALDPKAALTAGNLGVIAIEMKKVAPGLFYMITGLGKYAAESLVFRKIYPDYFSWNRQLSGPELVEFTTAIKDRQPAAAPAKK